MKVFNFLLILLFTTLNLYSQQTPLYWMDDSQYPAKLRPVTFSNPLPIKITNQLDTNKLSFLDKNNNFTGTNSFSQVFSPVSIIADSTIDCSLSCNFEKTLVANTNFTFKNFISGQTLNIVLTNTESNYTVSWKNPTGLTIKWSGGIVPVQTTGAKSDVYTFIRVGSIIYGTVIQNF